MPRWVQLPVGGPYVEHRKRLVDVARSAVLYARLKPDAYDAPTLRAYEGMIEENLDGGEVDLMPEDAFNERFADFADRYDIPPVPDSATPND